MRGSVVATPCRSARPHEELVAEHVDGIRDIQKPIIVHVRRVEARRCEALDEQVVQGPHRVGHVDLGDTGFKVNRLVLLFDSALQGFDQIRVGTGHQARG